MPRFNFHMGVTLRCYGNVEVEAETVDAALPLLTADFVGEHIEITETTTDSGQDLAVLDVSDAETGEELDDWDLYLLPSPYDPPSGHAEMLAALRLAEERIEMNNYGGEEDSSLATIRAAIATAEGRANG